MKFEQFKSGLVVSAGPYAITDDEIVKFASAYDPQWFHVDHEKAKEGRWNGLIASGWHTCAIAMRLACDAALNGGDSWGSPGVEYLKWTHPVRSGDSLTFVATVIDARRSATRERLGVVKWRWQLFNQQMTEVLDLVVHSLFEIPSTESD